MCWKTPQSWPLKVSFLPCPFVSAFLGVSEASLLGPHQALTSPEVVRKIIISFLTEKRYFLKIIIQIFGLPQPNPSSWLTIIYWPRIPYSFLGHSSPGQGHVTFVGAYTDII